MPCPWIVKDPSEESREVGPRDLAGEWREVDPHSTSRGIVCQPTGSYDRPVAVTSRHGGIGLGFSAQIDTEDVVAARRVLDTHPAQHHVMRRVDGRRIEQLDRTVTIHRKFSRRAATRSRARCEDNGVTSANRCGDLVDGRVLEITDLRMYARRTQVVGVRWVANQSDDIVAAIDEQARESGGDLPVRSGDCNSHKPSLSRRWCVPP